jgi:hypothetical protein
MTEEIIGLTFCRLLPVTPGTGTTDPLFSLKTLKRACGFLL